MTSPDTGDEIREEKAGEVDHEANTPTVDELAAEDSHDSESEYRLLPLFAGVVVPFSILLAIPSVTAKWYVRTGEKGDVVESADNPRLLEAGMIISLVCGVLANACLAVRFAERAIKVMTLLAIVLLTIHGVYLSYNLAVSSTHAQVTS